jgi:hypothetical protein
LRRVASRARWQPANATVAFDAAIADVAAAVAVVVVVVVVAVTGIVVVEVVELAEPGRHEINHNSRDLLRVGSEEQLQKNLNVESFEPTLNKPHDLWFKLISSACHNHNHNHNHIANHFRVDSHNNSHNNGHGHHNGNTAATATATAAAAASTAMESKAATVALAGCQLETRQVCFFLLFCFVLLD